MASVLLQHYNISEFDNIRSSLQKAETEIGNAQQGSGAKPIRYVFLLGILPVVIIRVLIGFNFRVFFVLNIRVLIVANMGFILC